MMYWRFISFLVLHEGYDLHFAIDAAHCHLPKVGIPDLTIVFYEFSLFVQSLGGEGSSGDKAGNKYIV